MVSLVPRRFRQLRGDSSWFEEFGQEQQDGLHHRN